MIKGEAKVDVENWLVGISIDKRKDDGSLD